MENSELKVSEKYIFQAFDLLRTQPILTSDFHVILFLLSLQREGLITDLTACEAYEMKYRFQNNIAGNLIAHNETFEDIYDKVYNSILDRFSSEGFAKLIHILLQIDQAVLRNSFKQLFEISLKRYQIIQGRLGGESYTPIQIDNFAISLVNIADDAKVYNPFSGYATYATLLQEGQNYLGQEINLITWTLGVLRLFAHDNSVLQIHSNCWYSDLNLYT